MSMDEAGLHRTKKKARTLDFAEDSGLYWTALNNDLVPEVGIEPTWARARWILSPVRLPVSPLRR